MKDAANILGAVVGQQPKKADLSKLPHLEPGRIVRSLDGSVFRVTSKVRTPDGTSFKLANLQGKPVQTPADFRPVSLAMARLASWMRYHLAFNKDFDLYINSYIEQWNKNHPKEKPLPYPIGRDGKPMQWAKWFQSAIAPKLRASAKDTANAAEQKDEAIHEMLFTVLGKRNILDQFRKKIKNFSETTKKSDEARQITDWLVSSFMYRVGDMQEKLDEGAHKEEVSMWQPGDESEGDSEVNILDTEEHGVAPEGLAEEEEAEIEKFRDGFVQWMKQSLRPEVAENFATLFDLNWEVIKETAEPSVEEERRTKKEKEQRSRWEVKREELEKGWQERTGMSFGALKEYKGRLPGLMRDYITENAGALGEESLFPALIKQIEKDAPKGKGKPAKASSLALAAAEGEYTCMKCGRTSPESDCNNLQCPHCGGSMLEKTADGGKPDMYQELEEEGRQDRELHEEIAKRPAPNTVFAVFEQTSDQYGKEELRALCATQEIADREAGQIRGGQTRVQPMPIKTAKTADDAPPDDGPDYYDFPKNWKEEETEETHDRKKQSASPNGLDEAQGDAIIAQIGPGDRVTIMRPAGRGRNGQEWAEASGRAVMRSSHGGWVLNMGGAHGTPGIADAGNVVKVRKAKRGGDLLEMKRQHEPEMRNRAAWREYRCKNCGNVQRESTNHTGNIIAFCNECSWKPSWRGDGDYSEGREEMSIPFGGRTYRPFEYVGEIGKEGSARKTAKLIAGADLTPEMKKQVQDAFIYRWTYDNPRRTDVYHCDKCDVSQQPYVNEKSSEGHQHPTVPLISDDQWIREHAFNFTNDGRLHPRRRHAEPAYLAQQSEGRVASAQQKFAVLKAAYNPGTAEYIYRADTYCENCANEIKKELSTSGNVPASLDETQYDSDSYPKGPYYEQEADTPQHCGRCGVFLENPLTQEGYRYLNELVAEHEISGRGADDVIQEWVDFYPERLDQPGSRKSAGDQPCCDGFKPNHRPDCKKYNENFDETVGRLGLKRSAWGIYVCPDCGEEVPETMIGQGTQVPMGHCPKCGGGAKALTELCPECEHEKTLHTAPYGCEYERGDAPGGEGDRGPYGAQAMGPCGCMHGINPGMEKDSMLGHDFYNGIRPDDDYTPDTGRQMYEADTTEINQPRLAADLAKKRVAPNTVVREVCNDDGRRLGVLSASYDGTPEDMVRVAQQVTDQMWNEYGADCSNMESGILATDESGVPKWKISPNFRHVEEIRKRAAEKKAWTDEDEETSEIQDRLEYLRGELQAERISYEELSELQGLADYIDPGDVELLEAAGVEEFPEPVVHEKTYSPTEDEKKMLKDMGIKAHKTSQGAGGTTVTMQDQNATFPGTTNGKEPMAVPDAIDQSPGPHSPNAPATAPRTPSIQPRIVDVPAGTVGDMATTASEDADWESMHPEEGKGFRWHGEPPVETVKHDRDLNDDDRKWLAQMKIKGSWKTAALDVVFRNERGFVTDFGARQEMVSGEGISGSIPRYGVWEGKKGIKGGRPQVTFTSDDLEECKGNLGEGNGLPSTGLPATGLRHGDPEEMWEKESASDGLDDETMREAMSLLDKQGAAPAAPPATVSPNVEQNKAIAPGAQPPAPGGSTVAILPGQDEEETGRHTVEPELQNPKYHMMSGFYGTAGADDLLASEEARLASQDED